MPSSEASSFRWLSCSDGMEGRKRIAVFCSSAYDIDEKYNAVARELVRAASLRNCEIVSGATVKGVMGVLCAETARLGVRHTGFVPGFMKDWADRRVNELHFTEGLSDRKRLILEGADAAVALPGGAGTMDEFFEALALRKLGLFGGRLVLVNLDGFYDGIVGYLDRAEREGMAREWRTAVDVVDGPEGLEAVLDDMYSDENQ